MDQYGQVSYWNSFERKKERKKSFITFTEFSAEKKNERREKINLK